MQVLEEMLFKWSKKVGFGIQEDDRLIQVRKGREHKWNVFKCP
jgi:hypothetical protein